MTRLEAALHGALTRLGAEGAGVALVGGLAVSAWVDPSNERARRVA